MKWSCYSNYFYYALYFLNLFDTIKISKFQSYCSNSHSLEEIIRICNECT